MTPRSSCPGEDRTPLQGANLRLTVKSHSNPRGHLLVGRHADFLQVRSVRTEDMQVLITDGDLLDQPVEAIVNAWNRNIIPWWLLLPQGVSGAIKRRGGIMPFREVARH